MRLRRHHEGTESAAASSISDVMEPANKGPRALSFVISPFQLIMCPKVCRRAQA
jgi:hypothetical protein